MNNSEQDNKVLIDALKYTSDIVVSLTEKISAQEQKISQLENIIIDLKNDIKSELHKNEKKVNNIFDKISEVEKSLSKQNNYSNNANNSNNSNNTNNVNNNDSGEDSNLDFEILSQTVKDLNSNLNLELDLETLNNTICNSTMLSEVSSFNLNDITGIKKNKVNNLVQSLIKQKLELEKKINSGSGDTLNKNNGLINTNGSNVSNLTNPSTNENSNTNANTNANQQDINAIRRKKNFARKF
jgi:hypothetical protein